MSLTDYIPKRSRSGNGPVNLPDLPPIKPTPKFIQDMAQRNGGMVEPSEPTDAHTARERHFAAALAIEGDAAALSENGQKALAIITQALDIARADRREAIEQAERDCAATEATLIRAAQDHIAATDVYNNLAKRHADAVRADGDKLLGVIREADERLKAKTAAILHAQANEPEVSAAQPQPEAPEPQTNE
jgi:hypothetical protein